MGNTVPSDWKTFGFILLEKFCERLASYAYLTSPVLFFVPDALNRFLCFEDPSFILKNYLDFISDDYCTITKLLIDFTINCFKNLWKRAKSAATNNISILFKFNYSNFYFSTNYEKKSQTSSKPFKTFLRTFGSIYSRHLEMESREPFC